MTSFAYLSLLSQILSHSYIVKHYLLHSLGPVLNLLNAHLTCFFQGY